MSKKRYPGVRPFETADKDLFFGRDRDVQELSVLIALEKMVVLFGKSGYGKSSLINAGIVPYLAAQTMDEESGWTTVIMRPGSYTEGASLAPVDNLLLRLQEKAPAPESGGFMSQLSAQPLLWHEFKRRQVEQPSRFLLIFDQFEEFFTYPPAQQDAFKAELAELLYVDMPQAVREAAKGLGKSDRQLLSEPLDVKTLFVIRADRLSLLDTLKDRLPAILHKRYELKALSEQQAREAIEKPALQQGDFVSPPFRYSPEALRLMVEKLSESKSGVYRSGVEAFQLQILCEYLEGEIVAGHIPGQLVQPSHFADKINAIFEGYYQRLLGKLPDKISKATHTLIEESLIFEDGQTGESRRLSVDADVLVQRYAHLGISRDTLQELENAFLLRREANTMGGFSYELSHDTLLAPILKLKAGRKAHEAAQAERQAARRRQRRLLTALGLALLSLATVIAIVVNVIILRNDAEEARKLAEKEKTKAERALESVLKAQQAKEKTEFGVRLERIAQVLRGGNCPDQGQLLDLDTMRVRHAADAVLQKKIKTVNDQLTNCR